MSDVSVEVGGMKTQEWVESIERDGYVAQRVHLIFETEMLEHEAPLPDAVVLELTHSYMTECLSQLCVTKRIVRSIYW